MAAPQLCDMLNQRYEGGEPSNDLERVGLIVRQIDKLNDPHRPWLPCPAGQWCHPYSDRWVAAILSSHSRLLYYRPGGKYGGGPDQTPGMSHAAQGTAGGYILDPKAVQAALLCAYSSDGATMGRTCSPLGQSPSCIPGCYPPGEQCQEVGRSWSCSFAPSHLKQALEAARKSDNNLKFNNELVFSSRSLDRELPNVILAFFFASTSTQKQVGEAWAARREFMRAYSLDDDHAPPMLRIQNEMNGEWPQMAGAVSARRPLRCESCSSYW